MKLKFTIVEGAIKPNGPELIYIPEEYSFYMSPVTRQISFDLVVNDINLTVVDDYVTSVRGFCPHTKWEKIQTNPPPYITGKLRVATTLKPGLIYRINTVPLLVHVNVMTRWICIGEPDLVGRAVEFITNCAAVIGDGGEFLALWLRPASLPKL